MLVSRLSGVECTQGSRAKRGRAVTDVWDKDIANLDMSEEEKNGLQVFRNYKRSFNDHAEKSFTEEIDGESFDVEHLERVLALIADEDARFLPVIACAYADNLLEAMFKAEMPDDVPGGKSALFGPYGPLSSLFNRLQLAFVFNMLSPDVVRDLIRTRRRGNDQAEIQLPLRFSNCDGFTICSGRRP